MKSFPLNDPTHSELGKLVVGHINMEMRLSLRNVRIFERDQIAREIQCAPEFVGEVLMQIDASDNGVTVCKVDFESAKLN